MSEGLLKGGGKGEKPRTGRGKDIKKIKKGKEISPLQQGKGERFLRGRKRRNGKVPRPRTDILCKGH